MSGKNLNQLQEELTIALLKGVVNGVVAFLGAWAVLGYDPNAFKLAGVYAGFSFVSEMRKLEWVSIGELPTPRKDKKQMFKESFKGVGVFI